MTSISRSLQEQIEQLEKLSAPYQEQLLKAANFVGAYLDENNGKVFKDEKEEIINRLVPYKREEWLLIWLLKKMKLEPTARMTPTSWWLLGYLIEVLPMSTAARILTDKEAIVEDKRAGHTKTSLLNQTLQEAQNINSELTSSLIMSLKGEKVQNKIVKKRKHSDQLPPFNMPKNELYKLVDAISKFLSFVVKSGKMITYNSDNTIRASLSAAYIKTAYTTSAEKSAETLGNWVTLCEKTLPSPSHISTYDHENWLFPFIELWDCKISSDTVHASFSLHCARPVLSLIRFLKKEHRNSVWLPELERLIARNLVNPAKAAYVRKSNLDLLKSLVKSSTFIDISNVPVIFEIFLRSHQPHKTWRRPEDDAWLTIVFKTLKDSISSLNPNYLDTIWNMLQISIENQFYPDLELLRSITSEILSIRICESWKLFADIIVLNPNVFLISNEEDLVSKLLESITNTCFDTSWTGISESVISKILVPLMIEFSKARDLSGFLKHWFHQLSIFERRRKKIANFSMIGLGAWDNNLLHLKLRELLEPSLTTAQIVQIINWLDEQIEESPDAVCTILEAVAGSLSGKEEIVDLISLKLYRTMFNDNRLVKLNRRYRWRAWKIVTHTLTWANSQDLDELAQLWETGSNPFLRWPGDSNSLLVFHPNDQEIYLDCIERFKCVCAALESSHRSIHLKRFIRPVALENLKLLSCDVLENFPFEKQLKLCDGLSDSNLDPKMRSMVYSIYALIRCAVIEYPRTLIYFPELKDKVNQILNIIFDLASESFEAPLKSIMGLLELPLDAISDLWISALRSDDILENRQLTDHMINIMLAKEFLSGPQNKINKFAIYSLSQIPLDLISKTDKCRIMQSWLPPKSEKKVDLKKLAMYQFAVISPVLALKRKIMDRYPNVYEGLEFEIINILADIIAEGKMTHPEVSLALLKELVYSTISSALINITQPVRKIYLDNAVKIIKKRIKKASEKKKYNLNFAFTAISEVVLVEFHKKSESLSRMGIISEDELGSVLSSFKKVILTQLKIILHGYKEDNLHKESNFHIQKLSIEISVEALTRLGVSASEIHDFKAEVKIPENFDPDIRKLLSLFFAGSERKSHEIFPIMQWNGDVSFSNRNFIKQVTKTALNAEKNFEKLKALYFLFETDDKYLAMPDKLLAIRNIIMCIDVDSKSSCNDNNSLETAGSLEIDFDLTKAYILLSTKLRTHSITQYAVDSTLGTISILCSPKSALLPANNAGTIYLHLTQLLHSILMHHRIKLRGHFPLVQLSMQGLLRCLFQPSLYDGNRSRRQTAADFGPAPAWLTNPSHQLDTKHAESYTRLILLISDLTTSSVPGAKHNNLNSAKEKWKRMSLLFMRFVLMDYIKWQLELRILPGIKETLLPGWYAVLDTTTPETRMLISAELNANGRAIFSSLYSDYQKFGKWKGS